MQLRAKVQNSAQKGTPYLVYDMPNRTPQTELKKKDVIFENQRPQQFINGPIQALHSAGESEKQLTQHAKNLVSYFHSNPIVWNEQLQQPFNNSPMKIQYKFRMPQKQKTPTDKQSPPRQKLTIYQSSEKQPFKRRPFSGTGVLMRGASPQQNKVLPDMSLLMSPSSRRQIIQSQLSNTVGFSQGFNDAIRLQNDEPIVFSSTYKSQPNQFGAGDNKRTAKMVPQDIKYSKEDLYDKALQSQIQVNTLNNENKKLQTRLQFMETQIGLQDTTGQVNALKRQIKDLRLSLIQVEGELDFVKHDVQTTKIKELKIENEFYGSEMIKMRMICDSLMKQKKGVQNQAEIQDQMAKSQATNQTLEKKLHYAQQKLQQQDKIQQQMRDSQKEIQEQMESLRAELRNQKINSEQQIQNQSLMHQSMISDLTSQQDVENKKLLEEKKAFKLSYEQKLQDSQAQLNEQQIQLKNDLRINKKELDRMRDNHSEAVTQYEEKIQKLEKKLQEVKGQINQSQGSIQNDRDNKTQDNVDRMRESHTKAVTQYKEHIQKLEKQIQNQNEAALLMLQQDHSKEYEKYNKIIKSFEEQIVAYEDQANMLKREIRSVQDQQNYKQSKQENAQRISGQTYDRGSSIKVDSAHSEKPKIASVCGSQKKQHVTESEDFERSSDDGNFRNRDIDSEKIRDAVNQKFQGNNNRIESDEFNDERDDEVYEDFQQSVTDEQSTQELVLTSDTAPIKDALFTLKRACQINSLKFQQIDGFLFGNEYKPEMRITMQYLSSVMQEKLRLQSLQANLFARYLVEQGIQNKAKDTKINQETKVLASRVITILMTDLNVHCCGIQHYSNQKVQKMQLIIGQRLLEQDIQVRDFDEFGKTLSQFGLGKETFDCALVHLLKLSESFQRVNNEVLKNFLLVCRNSAMSFSSTGIKFPVQEELLEYSLTEESEVHDQVPDEAQDFQNGVCEDDLGDASFERMDSTQNQQIAQQLAMDKLDELGLTKNFGQAVKFSHSDVKIKEEEQEYYPKSEEKKVDKIISARSSDHESSLTKSKKQVHFEIQDEIPVRYLSNDQLFLAACEEGDEIQFQKLSKIVDITVKNDKGQQGLHLCCENRWPDILSLLFDFDPPIKNVDPFDSDGETPLMIAVRSGDVKIIALCIQNTCNPFLQNKKKQSVIEIAQSIHDSQSKAEILGMLNDVINQWLQQFGQEKIKEIVEKSQFALESESEPKKSPELQFDEKEELDQSEEKEVLFNKNQISQNDMIKAIKKNDVVLVEKMLDTHNYPADDVLLQICIYSLHKPQMLQMVLENFELDINHTDSSGRSALHHACRLGKTDYIKILLEHEGIDRDLFDKKGRTPLMYAVKSEDVGAILYCVEHCLNPLLQNAQKMDAKIIASKLNHTEKSALIVAVLDQTIEQWMRQLSPDQVFECILRFQTQCAHNKNQLNERINLRPQLIQGIVDNDLNKISNILEQHYPVEDALLQVCCHGDEQPELLLLLFDNYVFDVNHTDSLGRSALHHACRRANTQYIEILLEQDDTDRDLFDNQGFTPLMCAVMSQDQNAVILCLEHACNPLLQNQKQKCAKTIAQNLPNLDQSILISVLLEKVIDEWTQKLSSNHIEESVMKCELKRSESLNKNKISEPKIKRIQLIEAIVDFNISEILKMVQNNYPAEDVLLQLCQHGNQALGLKDFQSQPEKRLSALMHLILDNYEFNINYTDSTGRSALHYACRKGQTEFITILLEQDSIDRDLFDNKGWTPLMCAVKSENIQAVITCIENGCNPLLQNSRKYSASIIAKRIKESNKSALVVVVLEKAVDEWMHRLTPDQILEIMLRFETQRASNKKTFDVHSRINLRPLLLQAIKEVDLEQIRIILEQHYPAEEVLRLICSKSNHSPELVHLLLDNYEFDINHTDSSGRSALHHACRRGSTQYIQILLDKDDIHRDLFDNQGFTPLMCAVKSEDEHAVILCLEHACNPLLQCHQQRCAKIIAQNLPHSDKSILIAALLEKVIDEWTQRLSPHQIEEQVMKCELTRSKTLSSVTFDASTVGPILIQAIVDKNVEQILEILKRHFPAQEVLLQLSIHGEQLPKLMHFLLDNYEFDLNHTDSSGRSALHHACRLGKIHYIDILLEQEDLDLDLFDQKGRTPLMYAVMSENENAVLVCLKHGCNPLVQDQNSQCAKNYAAKLTHVEKSAMIISLLDIAIKQRIQFLNFDTNQILATTKVFSPKEDMAVFKNNVQNHELHTILKNPRKNSLELSQKDELLEAIDKNQVEVVEKMLNLGYPVQDAFFQICKYPIDLKEMLDLVLDYNPDINGLDLEGLSGLHHVCRNANIEQMKLLFNEDHLNKNIRDLHRQTPLMDAILSESVEAVTECTTNLCCPFLENSDRESTLQFCDFIPNQEKGHLIKLILEESMNQWLSKFGEEGLAQIIADEYKNQDKREITEKAISQYNVSQNPSQTQKVSVKVDVSAFLPQKPVPIHRSHKAKVGQSVTKDDIIHAISEGEVEKVENFISQDIFSADDVLLLVCQYSNDCEEMLDMVLDFDPDLNIKDLTGRSPLYFSCRKAKIGFIKLLFDEDQLDKDQFDISGTTPLMAAVLSQSIEAIQQCLENGCNPFLMNHQGYTAKDLTTKFTNETNVLIITAMITNTIQEWVEKIPEGVLKKKMKIPPHDPIFYRYCFKRN